MATRLCILLKLMKLRATSQLYPSVMLSTEANETVRSVNTASKISPESVNELRGPVFVNGCTSHIRQALLVSVLNWVTQMGYPITVYITCLYWKTENWSTLRSI